MINEFIAFVLYEWPGADDVAFFCVGVSVGRAEHLLAGPFQTKAAACECLSLVLIVRRRTTRASASGCKVNSAVSPQLTMQRRPRARA